MKRSQFIAHTRRAPEHLSIVSFGGKAIGPANHDAHCVAYQLTLLAAAVTKLPNVGRALECQKWYQRDFQPMSPRRGSIGKRQTCARWSEH